MHATNATFIVILLMLIECGANVFAQEPFEADYSYGYVCDARRILSDGTPNWEYLAFTSAWSPSNPLKLSRAQRDEITKSLFETELTARELGEPGAMKMLRVGSAVGLLQTSLDESQIRALNKMVPHFVMEEMDDNSELFTETLSKSLPKKLRNEFKSNFKKRLTDIVREMRAQKWNELVKSSPDIVQVDFEVRKVKSNVRSSLYQQMDHELTNADVVVPGNAWSELLEEAKKMDVELVKEIKEKIEEGWKEIMQYLPDDVSVKFRLQRKSVPKP